jgi:hypothetical protein
VEVLSAYTKTWEKINNIQASQEMIPDKMNLINQSRDIFANISHSQNFNWLSYLSAATARHD